MYTSFYIKEERLDELKTFIRTELPSARFRFNPDKNGNKYHIGLDLTVEDSNKLNLLENKWYDEDNPKVEKISFLNKILSKFLI